MQKKLTYILKNYSWELIILTATISLYAGEIPKWLNEWLNMDSFYAFSLIMFVFIGYLLKQDIDKIVSIPKKSTFWGIPILTAAVILYVVGFKADFEYMLNLSLPLFLAGTILTLYGRKLFSHLLPILLLITSTLPVLPLHRITLPFQVYSSKVASEIMSWLGVSAHSEGVIMFINGVRIAVTPGCSGLKSLFSLFFISIVYSFFIRTSKLKKSLFIMLSIPLAISMNILRLSIVNLYALYNGKDGLVEFHDNVGIVVYVLSIGTIVLLSKLMEKNCEE